MGSPSNGGKLAAYAVSALFPPFAPPVVELSKEELVPVSGELRVPGGGDVAVGAPGVAASARFRACSGLQDAI